MNLLGCVKNMGYSNFRFFGNYFKYSYEKTPLKEISFRRLYNQQELTHIILKSIVKNQNLFLNVRWNAIPKLSN
jgi:hypothetical protein